MIYSNVGHRKCFYIASNDDGALDYVMAIGDSIRLLAMTSPGLLPDDAELVVSRMPQLEGLWIVELKGFYKKGLGRLLNIQVRKAS